MAVLYRNGVFLSRGCPQALVACDGSSQSDEKDNSNPVIKVRNCTLATNESGRKVELGRNL